MKEKKAETSISKNEAIALCKKNNLDMRGNITFSSRNKGTNTYWANPNIKCLNEEWWIIFNDIKKRELHICHIPVNKMNEGQIIVRNDKPHQIDIQINYNDESFIDSRSGINFNKWYVKKLSY